MMNRRKFLATSMAAGAVVAGTAASGDATSPHTARFRLNYAPHFGMFRHSAGDDLIDQIKFMADQGFTALEDNSLATKPVRLQERIRRELDRHGMQMGIFVGTADFGNPTFASGRKELRERVLSDIRGAVEVSKRMNAKWCSVVPGKLDARLPMTQQSYNVYETLRACLDICEPAGLVMVLEPLNHWGSRPQLFLHSAAQTFGICQAIGSPSCKMLFDIYHQQVTTGCAAEAIEITMPQIAYYQIGDNPGRKEPGTGDVDYRAIFREIHNSGFKGILGMEHGNSHPGRAGEQAVIEAYQRHDRF